MIVRLFFSLMILFCVVQLNAQQGYFRVSPCYNDKVSAYSAVKSGEHFFIITHDLEEGSVADASTKSKILSVDKNCELTDATLFHAKQQKQVSLTINSNTGPASFNALGNRLFICNTGDAATNGKLGIYVLEKTNDGWKIQQTFPFNSAAYNVMHPHYDDLDERLYFSSDKDGGFYNLYYVTYDGKKFGSDLHALTTINDETANDIFPSMKNQKFYFSSDRGSSNRLKIYKSDDDFIGYQKLDNSLFSSEYDDFALTMLSDRTGVFTTNRASEGVVDKQIIFRKKIDCSDFEDYSKRVFDNSYGKRLQRSILLIDEFKNIFGAENELVYKLDIDYLHEHYLKGQTSINSFYCQFFGDVEKISIESMKTSYEKSFKSEHVIDSVIYSFQEESSYELEMESLFTIVENDKNRKEIERKFKEEQQQLEKMEDELTDLTTSVEDYIDTLEAALEDNLKGQKVDLKNLPDYAQEPNSLFYAIQVGAFTEEVGEEFFKNIENVTKIEGAKMTYYITGYCNKLSIAEKSLQKTKKSGYKDAFIIAFCDGERIPVFKAKELIESGKCKPISKSVEPKIDESIPFIFDHPEKTKKEVNDGLYNKAEGAVEALASETINELFYTIQIGVFSKPATSEQIHDLPELLTTLLPDGRIRYSTGFYKSEDEANEDLNQVRTKISDALFITAYYKGDRISLSRAEELLDEKGEGILID